MNATTITPANWNDYKGATVILDTAKGEAITGTLISLNSKGWNVKDDEGRTITRTENVTTSLVTAADADVDADVEELDFDDDDADLDIEDDDAADVDMPEGDGHTTAELAQLFNTSARALRVQLRKLGLGVGKGRRYYLTDDELNTVRQAITA
jgi:hypothetical protein